jgi:hypothetical protein
VWGDVPRGLEIRHPTVQVPVGLAQRSQFVPDCGNCEYVFDDGTYWDAGAFRQGSGSGGFSYKLDLPIDSWHPDLLSSYFPPAGDYSAYEDQFGRLIAGTFPSEADCCCARLASQLNAFYASLGFHPTASPTAASPIALSPTSSPTAAAPTTAAPPTATTMASDDDDSGGGSGGTSGLGTGPTVGIAAVGAVAVVTFVALVVLARYRSKTIRSKGKKEWELSRATA